VHLYSLYSELQGLWRQIKAGSELDSWPFASSRALRPVVDVWVCPPRVILSLLVTGQHALLATILHLLMTSASSPTAFGSSPTRVRARPPPRPLRQQLRVRLVSGGFVGLLAGLCVADAAPFCRRRVGDRGGLRATPLRRRPRGGGDLRLSMTRGCRGSAPALHLNDTAAPPWPHGCRMVNAAPCRSNKPRHKSIGLVRRLCGACAHPPPPPPPPPAASALSRHLGLHHSGAIAKALLPTHAHRVLPATLDGAAAAPRPRAHGPDARAAV